MAASRISRVWNHSRFGVRYVRTQASESGYYVLLPEVPPDEPDTNTIMRANEYPSFSQISPDKVITGCAKLAIQYDVKLGNHIEELEESKKPKDFKSVFEPIEEISVPLVYAWKTGKILSNVKSSEGYSVAFQRVHPQVHRARHERWISQPLYQAVTEVSKTENLTEFQARLVNMYLTEARLNGLDIPAKERKNFLQIMSNLIEAQNHFRNRAMLSHNMFSHQVDDFGALAEMPKQILNTMAADKLYPSRGPWKVTLNQSICQPFLQYCSNRGLRWNVWQALNSRASRQYDNINLSNHVIIEDIRNHRRDMAKMLGFDNFAELSMETKMAGSVDNVLNMIESYKGKFLSQSQDEVTALQEFAISEGFGDKLEMYDIPYWRRKQKDHLHQVDGEDLAEYFSLDSVIQKLLDFSSGVFGITIDEKTSCVETWHEDARFYEITDSADGRKLAAFFVDPYQRVPDKQAGMWIETVRERSELVGTFPISYMHLNFPAPLGKRPTLLTVEQAASVFFEFGHGLQQMLTQVPYSEISGQRNVEWDSLQTCAKLMKMFFYHPQLMSSFSSHYRTGKQISPDVVASILQARSHMRGFDMMYELYLTAFDMEMNVSEKAWRKHMVSVWEELLPVSLPTDDNHPCSMTSIFSDQYPAAYYSLKWSEMIAADLMTTFDDVGFEDKEKLQAVGRRFRDTYLSLGGGVSASEIFRRFQGRDPSQDALVKYYTPLI